MMNVWRFSTLATRVFVGTLFGSVSVIVERIVCFGIGTEVLAEQFVELNVDLDVGGSFAIKKEAFVGIDVADELRQLVQEFDILQIRY